MKNSDLQNSDPPKNVTQKENWHSSKIHHDYFNCLTLSKYIGKLITTIQKEKEKCVICLCYPQNNKLGAVTVV